MATVRNLLTSLLTKKVDNGTKCQVHIIDGMALMNIKAIINLEDYSYCRDKSEVILPILMTKPSLLLYSFPPCKCKKYFKMCPYNVKRASKLKKMIWQFVMSYYLVNGSNIRKIVITDKNLYSLVRVNKCQLEVK